MASRTTYAPGLDGIIAGETRIASVENGLHYRGYAIEDLADNSSFVETAYILLEGELPSLEHLADFRAILGDLAEVDPAVLEFVAEAPMHLPLIDVLRTAISALGNFDAQPDEGHADSHLDTARRLIAQLPIVIAARQRSLQGQPLLPSDAERSFPNNLLYLLTGEDPPPLHERALDVAMILHADHEFETSTFTARLIASTETDLYSGIVGAIGALKGQLDGGGQARILEVLEEVGTPEEAQEWVQTRLADGRAISGFEQSVDDEGDPRIAILRRYCTHLAAETGNSEMESLAATIEEAAWDEGQLMPNLGWPTARLYHYLGLDPELAVPLFVASRVVGWCAHFIEQAACNQLIRPLSRYTGAARRQYVPVEERG